MLGQKLEQFLEPDALDVDDQSRSRERSLLYSILDAVTDPILLTDADGRLVVANARAITLFTASEDDSDEPSRPRADEQDAAHVGAVGRSHRADG